ncbi:MAG: hypothetical protein JXM75_04275 [Chromatiaceae bacterium]|nr:hypothetical protein [Chromatiaceae bacterium]
MFESIALGVLATLHQLDSMAVIGAFTLLLLALFAAALAAIARGRAEAFARATPTLLTTLGILGTFLGIAIGLIDFDVRAIEYSIPLLLDGLKLAFVTSIIGILLGVCLRLALLFGAEAEDLQDLEAAQSEARERSAVSEAEATQQTEIMARLALLAEAQHNTSEQQLELSRQLEARLARLDERLIPTLERQHGHLLEALDGFAHQLGEMGSRQLIAALETAIQDFNARLSAEFGANFRRLDDSVGKLLQWQDQYRTHMEGLGAELDQAIGAVKTSETTLRSLTEQALRISTHVEDQQAIMASLKRETTELEALLGGIADLRERAREAFPAMDSRLKTMLENVEGAVLTALETQRRLAQDSAHVERPRRLASVGGQP